MGDSYLYSLTYWFVFFQISFLIVGLGLYQIPIWRRWYSLYKATQTVKAKKSSTEELYVTRSTLESILFKNTKWARHLYLSFIKSWNDSRSQDSDKASAEIRLSDFFSYQEVLAKHSNQRMSEVLPGVYLAVGIFGTFMGLILGLRNIQVTQASPDEIATGISVLISGLSLAFWTSLFGIGSSILYSLIHKVSVQSISSRIEILEKYMTDFYPYETDAYYQRRFLELQTDIKSHMQGLATDIATAMSDVIGPAMGAAVSTHLAPVVDEMRHMLSQHLDRADTQQSEAVESMLKQYVEVLQGTFNTQIEEMAELIKNTSSAQEAISSGIQGFSEHLQSHFAAQSELVEKTGRAAHLIAESLDGMQTVSDQYTRTANHVEEVTAEFTTTLEKASELQTDLREIISEQAQSLVRTREDFESAWGLIRNGLEEAANRIAEMSDALGRNTGEHLQRALSSVDSTLGEIVNRFSGTLHEAREAIEELPGFMGQLSGSMDAVTTTVNELGKLVKKFEETSKNTVIPNIEVVQESAVSLASSVNESGRLINEMSQLVDQLDGRMNSSIQEVRDFLQNELLPELKQSTHGEGIVDVLEKSHNEMTEVVENIRGKIETLDEKAAKIVVALNKGVPEEPKPTDEGRSGRRIWPFGGKGS